MIHDYSIYYEGSFYLFNEIVSFGYFGYFIILILKKFPKEYDFIFFFNNLINKKKN